MLQKTLHTQKLYQSSKTCEFEDKIIQTQLQDQYEMHSNFIEITPIISPLKHSCNDNILIENNSHKNTRFTNNKNNINEIFTIENFCTEIIQSQKNHQIKQIAATHNDESSHTDNEKISNNLKELIKKNQGSLEKGDIPDKILHGKISEKGIIYFVVEWKTRSNGVKPMHSALESSQLKKFHSHMIIEYYETKALEVNFLLNKSF